MASVVLRPGDFPSGAEIPAGHSHLGDRDLATREMGAQEGRITRHAQCAGLVPDTSLGGQSPNALK